MGRIIGVDLATTEFVVPRSTPMILPMCCLFLSAYWPFMRVC